MFSIQMKGLHNLIFSLSEKTGDLQTSYILVQKALASFPQHTDSK